MTNNRYRSFVVRLVSCLLLAVLLSGVAVSAQAQSGSLPPLKEGNTRLGINFIPPAQPWLNRAKTIGAGANRWQLNWQDIESEPGKFYWEWVDSEIHRMWEARLEVHAILHTTPEWAREPGKLVPRNLYRPWNDPENYWGRFVRQAVDHYREKVHIWEVWNEPDWNQYWDGSVADYYQLLKVAYQAIKAADPNAAVVIGGLSYWHDPQFFEQLLDLIQADPEAKAHHDYFDVMAVHWYSRSSLLFDKVKWMRAAMAARGMQKDLWVNETNVPLWGEGRGPATATLNYASREEQASFVIQAFANAFAAGAERVFIFRMSDDQMSEAFGLLNNKAEPRPAYTAFHVVATYLGDAIAQDRIVANGVVRVVFRKGKTGRVTVLWNEMSDPTQATVEAMKPQAWLVDQDGTQRELQAQAGKYTIELPGATNRGNLGPNDYAIGGRTFLLVETDEPKPAGQVIQAPGVRLLGGDFGVPRRGANVTIDDKGNRFAWLAVTDPSRPVSRLAYVLRVPQALRQPTLTFDYALDSGGDLFTVFVYGDSTLTSRPLLVAAKPTGWRHAGFDLTRYRGRMVRIEFALNREPKGGRTMVKLDNVKIGEGGTYLPLVMKAKAAGKK